ncbi:MAG: Lrp/AsnC family transcriptional regulator [Bacteroidota bacterium]
MVLDFYDKRILHHLQLNAKVTHRKMSEELGLSLTAVYERVKRLERNGIIKKYSIEVDASKLGKKQKIFCLVNLKNHSKKEFSRFVGQMDGFSEVMECYQLAGEFDFMLKVLVRDIADYQEFIIDKFGELENVAQVKTAFVLSDEKISEIIPVD